MNILQDEYLTRWIMNILQDEYLTKWISYKINILQDEYLTRWISYKMNILQDKYLTRRKKEGKRGENLHKIQFLLPILCVKDNFYFKLRKNWLLSDINHLGIFISILSCEMIGFTLFFWYLENLICFIRLMILTNHRTA